MIVLQDFFYLIFVTIQVFSFCFWGNEVTLESQNVGQAAYEANFVGSDVDFQKGLALIMHRSLKPVYITAGKFANLSIQTFVGVSFINGRETYSLYTEILKLRHLSCIFFFLYGLGNILTKGYTAIVQYYFVKTLTYNQKLNDTPKHHRYNHNEAFIYTLYIQ